MTDSPPKERRRVFAERLKEVMNKKRISQTDLARKLEVTPTAVWNWEQGFTTPRQHTMGALADFLEVPESWLSGEAQGALSGLPLHAMINLTKGISSEEAPDQSEESTGGGAASDIMDSKKAAAVLKRLLAKEHKVTEDRVEITIQIKI